MLDGLRSFSFSLVGCVLLCATPQTSSAQQPAPATAGSAEQQPTHPASQSLSAGLGVYVFPAENQTPEQQNGDESSCYSWAKDQTGIDPLAPPASSTPAAQTQQSAPNPAKGSGVKGAAGGAAAGAAIGAIAGDAGEGAAIGATAGAIKGKRQGLKAKKQAAAQQQQAQQQAQAEAQAQQDERKNTYNKAFSACMEGKGYTVK
jgi:OmpA family protein